MDHRSHRSAHQYGHNTDSSQEDMVNTSSRLRRHLRTIRSNLLVHNRSTSHKLLSNTINMRCKEAIAFRRISHTIRRLIHHKHHYNARQHNLMETRSATGRLRRPRTITIRIRRYRRLAMETNGLHKRRSRSSERRYHRSRLRSLTELRLSTTMIIRRHTCHRPRSLFLRDSSPHTALLQWLLRTTLHNMQQLQQMADTTKRKTTTDLRALQLLDIHR